MWVVAKYNIGQVNIFRKELSHKASNVKFYVPKIKISFFKNKKIYNKERSLLNGYLLCFSKDFSNPIFMNNISGIKGLTYFLKGENLYQREILKFIESCKLQEDCDGYIKKEYTDLSFTKLYQFNSGPLTNLFFKLIEKNKKQIKVPVGNKNIFLKKNIGYSYQLA